MIRKKNFTFVSMFATFGIVNIVSVHASANVILNKCSFVLLQSPLSQYLNHQLRFYQKPWFLITYFAVVVLVAYLFFRLKIQNIERHRRRLTTLFRERTIHVEMQKEELKVQTENLMEVNNLLKESREEILKKKEELQVHADNMNEVNVLLREKQEEIQAQSEELSRANSELCRLNATKDKFFSIIAHDLKNPFHAIISFSNLLIEDYDKKEDAEIKEILNVIYQSSSSASSLLDKLLQWARSQSNKVDVDIKKQDVAKLVNEVIPLHKGVADEKGIQIVNEVPPGSYAMADVNMLMTVLRNLISNAIKFTPKEGKITLSAKKKSENLELEISDTGVGMSKKALDSIFKIDQYYSTEGTLGESGTGLGLVICKEFIEKNKGEIKVESENGIGSTFIISLPHG